MARGLLLRRAGDGCGRVSFGMEPEAERRSRGELIGISPLFSLPKTNWVWGFGVSSAFAEIGSEEYKISRPALEFLCVVWNHLWRKRLALCKKRQQIDGCVSNFTGTKWGTSEKICCTFFYERKMLHHFANGAAVVMLASQVGTTKFEQTDVSS
ncbi:hypothetical protein EJB05_37284 [Eragrostis curvula]|uniref:Uncharacterized protein n=1 Tax=Eragrostis curvula TaxID=38414 RepID=A0A5J9TR43_9POAL|nr:hypothetical protein EJB05_37284 [Eragrostis curvula]